LGQLARPEAADRNPAPNYRIVALIVASSLFMEHLDATVLTTALPTMARDLRAPIESLSSALTAYLLGLAIFIPASGRLADRFGSRTVFRLAIILFLAGSVLCAQAHDLPLLVAARFLQGVGGSMMTPIGRLVLLRSVRKQDVVDAMSWFVMPATLGPIVGPPLGGFIVTYLDWRWIFYLNLPIGLLGVVLVGRYIVQVREDDPPATDWIGFVLSGASLSGLLFGFETASRSQTPLNGLLLLACGAVAGGLYVAHARRRPNPILDLTLLRIPTFRLAVIAGALTRITNGAQPFLVPLMLQVGFGMTPAKSGSITIAGAIGGLAMKGLAGRILRRFDFRRILILNGLLASAGYAICGFFKPDWPAPLIFAVLVANGFLMSFQFTVYNAIAYDELPPARMSAATSFYATLQQLMLSVGICVGAGALHLAMLAGDRARPSPDDFSVAFWVVTAISAAATFWNRKFAPEAGQGFRGAPNPSASAR
jgi:EmrB/QacA subfamily drug resistance transporter